jgi:ribose transport system substrate-binding protein
LKRPIVLSSAPDREGPTIVAGMPVRESLRQEGSQGSIRVPALARTVTVLQGICDAGHPMGLAELAEVTGFPKSSVMRICHALTEEHLLARGVDGTYALGSRVFELGSAARSHNWRLRDIGFTYPVDESFFVAEINALRAEATTLGGDLQVRCAAENKDRQSQQIRDFVAGRVDLILVEPVVSEGLEAACAYAHAARIPVVAIGSAHTGADAVVATDNTKAGTLAGAALAKALAGQGRVAVVGGIPITANSDRVAGFLGAIAAYPGMTVVATSRGELDAPSGQRAAEEILATHPTVEGFFASNDQIAIGISGVLSRRDLSVPIVSVDGAQGAVDQIRSGGPIIATATQDPVALVRAAIEIGSALRSGLGVVRQSHYIPPRLIDVENAEDYQPWG